MHPVRTFVQGIRSGTRGAVHWHAVKEGRVPSSAPAAPSPQPRRRDPKQQGLPAPISDRGASPFRVLGRELRIRRRMAAVLLCGLSLLASYLALPPVGWWPLGYVCLVPWLVVVCALERARFVYFVSYLFGIAFFMLNVWWIFLVTAPGYFALGLYFAIYFPLAAWPIRHLYRRRKCSVAIAAPIAWVAVEYLRSLGPLGFPWVLLGHSQYQVLTIIQISDLVGAYGVSFVLAMVNGWLADLLIQPIYTAPRSSSLSPASPQAASFNARLPVGSLATLLVVLGSIIYGSLQGAKSHFHAGPRVAVVQGDFVMYPDQRAWLTPDELMFDTYLALARQAAEEKPDLIVLPETAWSGSANDEYIDASPEVLENIRQRQYPKHTPQDMQFVQSRSRKWREEFLKLSRESGVPILLGGASVEWKPKEIAPRVERYNSAFLIMPNQDRPVVRYDKVHLVLFGEYVPFRYTELHWLYEWLNKQTPFGQYDIEYSLTPGEAYNAFEFPAASQGGKAYRAAAPICYEEVMPYIARRFALGDGKRIDLLLSISNDGWFHHSGELEQHLAAAVFRAVENRIGIARSVNTGTSALVRPNGLIHNKASLTSQKIEALPQLETVLERIREVADQMSSEQEFASYDPLRRNVYEMLNQDLKEALKPLGNEFGYISARLAYLAPPLHPEKAVQEANPSAMSQLQKFRLQLEEDLMSVARWADHPETAPGYAIGEVECDDRLTLYTRFGDRFAQLMLILTGVVMMDWLVQRIRRKNPEATAAL